jgi:dTDP-4-dehydrorhamnose 3,5-epimerase
MKASRTEIPDVVRFEPDVYRDDRGFFLESFNKREMAMLGLPGEFVQDNHSRSSRHVLRGLHYQIARPQGKLVRVVAGEVLDVAVDIRSQSPTFGKHVSMVLSGENMTILWIPPGFAHGFFVRSEHADFLYRTTDYYSPQHERTIAWNDPTLAIDWGIPPGVSPIQSAKDREATRFLDAETYA